MAWPTEAGSIASTVNGGVVPPPEGCPPSGVVATPLLPPALPASLVIEPPRQRPLVVPTIMAGAAGELFDTAADLPVSELSLDGTRRVRFSPAFLSMGRIFNTAEYRFYFRRTGPPVESDVPFETSPTMPYTTIGELTLGPWFFSMSYFNGVIDSGFRPLGPKGQTYVRIEVDNNQIAASPGDPAGVPTDAPLSWSIEAAANGGVVVNAVYQQLSADRATNWGISYTTNGQEPVAADAANPADVLVAIGANGISVLSYSLPAQGHGTTVKVRLQTMRSADTYSEGSTVQTVTADAVGPSVPLGGDQWPGRLPEGI